MLQLESNGWHPVHYSARSLTKIELTYAPIEREALAILHGAIKFHHYVFGRQFLVETDHRPLVSIFGGYLNEAPARIQCLMLKMQRYDYSVQWVPRKFIIMADSLSKRPRNGETKTRTPLNEEIDLYVNEIKQQIPVSDDKWKVCKRNRQ